MPEKKRVAYEQLTAFSSLYKLCAYELNPGIAHMTQAQIINPELLRFLEIASRGVPTLLINHFYIPLDINPPEYKIESKKPNPTT